ncbi:MAG: hypothetical protein V8Q30_11460 [Acutalibacteraceae bacterium]
MVTATGMNTEMGKIANLLEKRRQPDPLQEKLASWANIWASWLWSPAP